MTVIYLITHSTPYILLCGANEIKKHIDAGNNIRDLSGVRKQDIAVFACRMARPAPASSLGKLHRTILQIIQSLFAQVNVLSCTFYMFLVSRHSNNRIIGM